MVNNPHFRGADVELIMATIFDHITAALARGKRVELRGFGVFTVRRRDARLGRNPRTGNNGVSEGDYEAVLQGRQATAWPAQSRQMKRRT
jgi:hypothetical protein